MPELWPGAPTAALRPVRVNKQSPVVGETCALCKAPFAPGDETVLCPVDEARHHVQCWRSNEDHCSALGCEGQGQVLDRPPRVVTTALAEAASRVVPATATASLAQGCLVLALAVAILLFAVGCFGLWAIADYIMLEILQWNYRAPLVNGVWPWPGWLGMLHATTLMLA